MQKQRPETMQPDKINSRYQLVSYHELTFQKWTRKGNVDSNYSNNYLKNVNHPGYYESSDTEQILTEFDKSLEVLISKLNGEFSYNRILTTAIWTNYNKGGQEPARENVLVCQLVVSRNRRALIRFKRYINPEYDNNMKDVLNQLLDAWEYEFLRFKYFDQ